MSSGTVDYSALKPELETQMETGDWIVIAVYFVIVFIVGIWSSVKTARSSEGGGSMSSYFLAGRDMNLVLVGASLFASNIGSGHFVGLAGSGASSGIAVAGFELNAIFILMLLGWLFVPVYISSGVFTMPEYLRRRFGGQRIRVYLSMLALLLYVFTKISADLFAGAIFINVAVPGGFSLYPAVLILLAIACIFTIAGGLSAVIWTDAVQVVIMIIGSFILMVMSFVRVGGYNEMVRQYYLAIPPPNVTLDGLNCAGLPRADSMNLLRSASSGDLPWSGMIFGLTINSVWYWCADQVIVQRALAAKSFTHAKAGCVLAALLKFLPLWLLVFPGMIARILFPKTVGCTDPEACEALCQSRQGCSNSAYPLLIMKLLPHGLRGLMMACMLSALMSSLTSIFNSSSTIFTVDVYPVLKSLGIRVAALLFPKRQFDVASASRASETELVIVGRLFVLILVAISVIWIPIIEAFKDAQLFNYIQAVTAFLAPPVCAVFVLGIFVPQVNEPGAFWGLISGFVVGIVKFILEIVYSAPACNEPDNRPLLIAKVHFLHFAILLFCLTVIVTLVISAITPQKPTPEQDVKQMGGPYGTHRSFSALSYHRGESGEEKVQTIQKEKESMGTSTQTRRQKVFRMLCCLWGASSSSQEMSETEEERQKRLEEAAMTLDEVPKWRRLTDISAIVVMAIAVFFWVFYA